MFIKPDKFYFRKTFKMLRQPFCEYPLRCTKVTNAEVGAAVLSAAKNIFFLHKSIVNREFVSLSSRMKSIFYYDVFVMSEIRYVTKNWNYDVIITG